ncbi:MAG: hypothetical protein P3X24_007430 [bacterium]|nr:hypothetical protein [bacterium]
MSLSLKALLPEPELREVLRKRAMRNSRKPLWEVRAILREVLGAELAPQPAEQQPEPRQEEVGK